MVPLTPTTGSLKVAVMFPVRLTEVEFELGDRVVSVGAVVSAGGAAAAVVNVQDTVASGLLAASRMADAPPVRVAVYGGVRGQGGGRLQRRDLAGGVVGHASR